MINMEKKSKAFTLAEALILLLIAALLAAALVPVITRKHKDVAEHGKWICTLNSDGKHVIKTVYRGKTSDFELADAASCTFTPPASAKNFTIKAVGGGGGGGGGTAGDFESVYNSKDDDAATYAGNVENDGYYSIVAVGGGGGGGGMACGEAKDQITAQGFDLNEAKYFIQQSQDHHGAATGGVSEGNQGGPWHEDWAWDMENQKYDAEGRNPTPCDEKGQYQLDCSNLGSALDSEDPYHPKTYEYGYFDLPVSGFDYKLLYQNDKRFTDNYDYGTQNPEPKVSYTDEKGQFVGEKISAYDFKYKYLPTDIGTESELKNKGICFAEDNWPMSKEIAEQHYKGLYLSDMDSKKPNVKCWNLPGVGGEKGQQNKELEGNPIFLKGGQGIYATVGQQGKGRRFYSNKHTVGLYVPDNSFSNLVLKTAPVEDGGEGFAGGDTTVYLGKDVLTASGGKGGAARELLPINFYINIPVQECEVMAQTKQYDNDTRCPSRVENAADCHINFPDDCNPTFQNPCTRYDWVTHSSTNADGTTSTWQSYDCVEWNDPHYTCPTNQHPGEYYYSTGCVQRVRPKYFDNPSYGINTCVYTAEIPESHPARSGEAKIMNFSTTENFWTGLDYPYFQDPVKEYVSTDTEDGEDYDVAAMFDRQRYQGDPGSGGYGAGEQVKSYIQTDDLVNSYGILYGEDGEEGYVTIIKSSAYGGTGGEAGQYISTMTKKLGNLRVIIGKPGMPGGGSADGGQGGTTRIFEGPSSKPMFELQGGKGGQAKKMIAANSTESVPGANGAPSPIENESNRAKIVPRGGKTDGNTSWSGESAKIFSTWDPNQSNASVLGAVTSFLTTGGHPLDLTYGAGGGGGAGGKTASGGGGAGTPGVVIIEW